jgi:sugar lactone lactonase YvrE
MKWLVAKQRLGLIALLVVVLATSARSQTSGPLSLARDPRLELVAALPGPMPAGVVIDETTGRTFLSFPMWGDPHRFSLMELAKDGSLVPFPADQKAFTSIQGLDAHDGRLYVLDAGSAKLHVIDLATRQIERTHTVPGEVLGKGPYLNDIRVDPARRVAYISDSMIGGVLIINLATEHSFRRLSKHPAARAEPNFTPTVEGVRFPSLRGNTDGIALSPDGATLYFTPFSSHSIYSIATADLLDPSIPEVKLAPTKITTKPSANDGLSADAAGNVYSTDYEDHAIRRTTPAGATTVLVQDPRLLWPDATWPHGGYLYITTNQMNRMPGLHKGKDLRVQPHALYRYPLPR